MKHKVTKNKSFQPLACLSVAAMLCLMGCAAEHKHIEGSEHMGPYEMGRAAQEKNDLPLAIHHYRDAIAQDSGNKLAYLGLGFALLDSNQIDESYKTFKRAAEKFGKCGDVYRGLGAVFVMMDRPEEAVEEYERALSINVHDAKAINGEGVAFELMGETQKAQAAYRAAMELDPSNMSYESNLGLSLALNGEPQEGIRILERVARIPSASPRARQNLALAYGLSGDMEMARRMGRADLSDEAVRGNLNYIRSVREMSGPSNRYVNVLPVNREESTFDVSRTWIER